MADRGEGEDAVTSSGLAVAASDVVEDALDALDGVRRLLEPGLVRLPYADRLDELLSRTRDICRADAATLLIADHSGDLVVTASVGLEQDAEQRIRVDAGTGLAGRAAARRAVVVVEDRAGLAAISPALIARGMETAAAVPMIVSDDVVGVLVVASRQAAVFERHELVAIDVAAERLALAVEHQRLTDAAHAQQSATDELATRYRALHELATALAGALTPGDVIAVALEHGLRALDATDGTIALLEGDTLRIVGSTADPDLLEGWATFPVTAPAPMAESVREGRPIFTSDQAEFVARYPAIDAYSRGSRGASACLPLAVPGVTLGSLGLIFADERSFGASDRELLATVAQQCAQALARARLYQAEHEATTRLRFLVEASGLLLTSLDYETTLRSLADTVVPTIADWCAIDIATGDSAVRRLAVAHVDPAKVALARELHERVPFDPNAPTGVAAVLRTGETEYTPDITDDVLVAAVRDPDLLATMRELQLRSAMAVPLKARGRVLGVMTLVMAESGRRYDDDDVAIVEELARLAGVAIDNAQLFNDRSEVARALQSSLLPPVLPTIPRLEVAARYLPSGSQAEVGGDFYDVFRDVDGQWALVIGDVCGKGPEAAAVTGLARHTVRAVAQHDAAPGAVLEAVNTALLDQVPVGRFCTIGYARFDVSGPAVTVTVASGGHPLPLVRRPSGLVEAVGRPGMLVGVTQPAMCPEDVVVLAPGDALLLYTDGLVERHQAAGGVEDGEPALRAVLSRCDDLDADRIADLILSVSFDQPHSARDDVALLVVRVAE